MTTPPFNLAPRTLAVHPWATSAGRPRAHRTLNAPLLLTTQWEGADLSQLAHLFGHEPDAGFYTRFGHPTTRMAEESIAGLEGAEDALCFGSGMAAITTSLLAVLRSGDHVVAHQAIFGQTIQFLEHIASALGIAVTFVDATDVAAAAAAMRPNTRVLYLETPSNPVLDIVDIAALAETGHRGGALVFVDSTFAGPMLQQPLSHGADLVLHSASKSLSGHADVMAGVVAGPRELVQRIRRMRSVLGPVLDPHASWLLLRGLQTLPLRMRAACETARQVAAQISMSPEVSHLRYPFLSSHPGAVVARRQMREGGSMVSFALRGGIEAARRFVGALSWIPIASSLGSVFTSIEVPEELDFAPEEIGERGAGFAMPSGFMRLSIGTEAIDDVLRDIALGLDAGRSS